MSHSLSPLVDYIVHIVSECEYARIPYTYTRGKLRALSFFGRCPDVPIEVYHNTSKAKLRNCLQRHGTTGGVLITSYGSLHGLIDFFY